MIVFTNTSEEKIKIEIYDILGRKIKTLADEYFESGRHNIVWDATDENGRIVSSGTYFCKAGAGSKITIRKMMFVR
jgi:flagellar hook assembly protein FlgD